jgi:hypothetical protein
MRAAGLCIRVCTGGVQVRSPGDSSGSQTLVSRISNSPRYAADRGSGVSWPSVAF